MSKWFHITVQQNFNIYYNSTIKKISFIILLVSKYTYTPRLTIAPISDFYKTSSILVNINQLFNTQYITLIITFENHLMFRTVKQPHMLCQYVFFLTSKFRLKLPL